MTVEQAEQAIKTLRIIEEGIAKIERVIFKLKHDLRALEEEDTHIYIKSRSRYDYDRELERNLQPSIVNLYKLEIDKQQKNLEFEKGRLTNYKLQHLN
jgi:hypothetical protein